MACSDASAAHLSSLIVKVTSSCNLACAYCYSAGHQRRLGRRIVPDHIVRAAIDGYARLADEGRGVGDGGASASFGWHGGEPLLAGASFFRAVLRVQREAFGSLERVRNAFNTNGTLIADEWVDLWTASATSVAVSLDGPPDIHDYQRPAPHGGGSSAAALAGFSRLRDAGLNPGVVLVVTERTAKDVGRLFRFLRDIGVQRLAFSPQFSTSATRSGVAPVSPVTFGRFLVDFFDLWRAENDGAFVVRDFDLVISRIFGGVAELCEYGDCGAHLALDTDGHVYYCDLYTGNEEWRVGRLGDRSLAALVDSTALASLRRRSDDIPSRCRECEYFAACGGGCMHRRQGWESGRDFNCEAKKYLVDRVLRELSHAGGLAAAPDCPSLQRTAGGGRSRPTIDGLPATGHVL